MDPADGGNTRQPFLAVSRPAHRTARRRCLRGRGQLDPGARRVFLQSAGDCAAGDPRRPRRPRACADRGADRRGRRSRTGRGRSPALPGVHVPATDPVRRTRVPDLAPGATQGRISIHILAWTATAAVQLQPAPSRRRAPAARGRTARADRAARARGQHRRDRDQRVPPDQRPADARLAVADRVGGHAAGQSHRRTRDGRFGRTDPPMAIGVRPSRRRRDGVAPRQGRQGDGQSRPTRRPARRRPHLRGCGRRTRLHLGSRCRRGRTRHCRKSVPRPAGTADRVDAGGARVHQPGLGRGAPTAGRARRRSAGLAGRGPRPSHAGCPGRSAVDGAGTTRARACRTRSDRHPDAGRRRCPAVRAVPRRHNRSHAVREVRPAGAT